MSRRTLVLWVAAAGSAAVVGGGAVAGACTLTSLNCHLRDSPPAVDPLAATAGTVSLPDGFDAEVAASHLELPTAFDFLPDGRILVGEKSGLVKLVDRGRTASMPALDLRKKVNTQWFRGLVAVAVDPGFDENRFVYVSYAVRRKGTKPTAPTFVRVSRFVLGEDASAGQERVLLGAEASAADACTALPPTADCIPSPGDHIGADIVFASDGTLFVGTGDGGGKERVEETAFRAQDVEALGGKILRITRDGRGVASNPFYDGDPTSNRSKVWALGLRNPFRLTLAPGADLPVVADVGWITQDEITVAPAGSNLGWPCFEGDERTPRYEETERCVEMYGRADDVQPPVLAVPHSGSSSVTGGVFYTGRGYPEEYRSYFYANWTRNEILHARINASRGELEAKPSTFARGAGGPVAFRLGPDGLLYFLSLNYGELYRVSYAG